MCFQAKSKMLPETTLSETIGKQPTDLCWEGSKQVKDKVAQNN